MPSFNAAGVCREHGSKEGELATDEGSGRDGPRPGALIQFTPHSIIKAAFCTKHCLAEMDPESEFTIQTRFEKYAEFVALQNQALSLDISPQAFNEESNRRINLMQDMVNIVR
jgi:hypothetical protein